MSHWGRWDPGQPLWRMLVYRATRDLIHLGLILLYRVRIVRRSTVSQEGGLLVICNHQSLLDPPLVGIAVPHRHIVPLAKVGLFKSRFFGTFIKLLNAIPLKQDEPDAAAMRRALNELKNGRAVMIFPEGARTLDGELQPFMRGTWLLVKRGKCDVLPMAVEGAFNAWPRTQALPSIFGKRVGVAAGDIVPYAQLETMTAEDGLALLAERVEALRLEVRHCLKQATNGRYPPDVLADESMPVEGAGP